MDPIQRTTSTGHVLTLLEDSTEASPPAPLEEIRHALGDAWEAAKSGKIVDVCVLGVPFEGSMELYNTVQDLGDLALLRDELSDAITATRHGDDDS